MNKMRKHALLALCLGLVLGLNIYFRLYPAYFPQLKSQAVNAVDQRIVREAILQADKEFSGYSTIVKDKLVKSLVSDYRKANKKKIKEQFREEYQRLKDPYQDQDGQTYLMELDCWHWARYTENVVRLEHPGDRVADGYQVDDLMLAPLGGNVYSNQFLFYLSAFLYRVFS
ncbi:MAG: STT3 domain-containing protein, partial [Candidatus Omnitrophica bacterium]|nr:STT3 domain-containing protein [Candidatus Omnitrophota bacterium]